jgi:hypothetical protein
MRRKDEMENLVAKKSPPRDGSAGNGKRGAPSATNKSLITRNLRIAYGEVASEPLPEEWLKLLNQIDDGSGGEGKKS